MSSILETKKALERAFFSIPGVSGIGLSLDETTIIVYVVEHTDAIDQAIPKRAADYPIRIVEIGHVRSNAVNFNAFDQIEIPFLTQELRKQRWRPIIGGISAGHIMTTAGTLGGCVVDPVTNERLFISNNHVFANSSSLAKPSAQRGDLIVQPGVADGGWITDEIATLDRWIDFDDSPTGQNLVDVALAKPVGDIVTYNGILGKDEANIITIRGVAPINNYSVQTGDEIKVKKAGRTTGYTLGTVKDVNFSTIVDYGDGKVVRFVDQILADVDLNGGDSGSLLLNTKNNVVGLVFASTTVNGKTYAVANKIRNVTTMMNVEFETNDYGDEQQALTSYSISNPFIISSILGFGIGSVIMGLHYATRRSSRSMTEDTNYDQ